MSPSRSSAEPKGLRRIASLAGVSPATVSRVVNKRPGVRPELRQAVETAIREHGLDIDVTARALKSRKTGRLAVIIPRPAEHVFVNPFFTEILRGVASNCERTGLTMMVITAATSETLYEVNRNRSCDGVLFLGFRKSIPDPKSLRGATVPVVAIPRPGPRYSLPFVGVNDEEGSREAVAHLVSRGHSRIALLSGPHNSVYSIPRLSGYRRALEDAHLPYDRSMVVEADFTRSGGRISTLGLLERSDRPTAIFALSDHMASGAFDALRSKGLRIPADVAVVGFGNTPVCTDLNPALTSVDEQLPFVGERAASLLASLAQGQDVAETQIVLPTKLAVRESS